MTPYNTNTPIAPDVQDRTGEAKPIGELIKPVLERIRRKAGQ